MIPIHEERARRAAVRERYLRDTLPVRLGNLASNLARIAACAERPGQHDTVYRVLTETQWFIEWTGPQADPDVQPELVRLQVELAGWRLRYSVGGQDPAAAEALAQLARERSDQVLRWSGLLG